MKRMNQWKKWCAALCAVAMLAGCSSGAGTSASTSRQASDAAPVLEGGSPASSAVSSETPGEDVGRAMKDREGNDIVVPEKIERIISTAPSNTEILVGLGQTDRLVAVDQYAADVEGIAPSLPQINFREPDAEALVALEPDLIIASGHNRRGGEDPFALLEEAGICVAYIPSSYSIQGICDDIAFVAQLTGADAEGQKLVSDYMKQVEEIRAIGSQVTEKKKVYFEIAPAPDLSSFGKNTFLNEFLEVVGAENIFADQEGWLSPSAESVIERSPDVILTDVSYVDDAVGEILSREGWNATWAVAHGAVHQIDANPASRPSQYSIEALRQIAAAVYPELYRFDAAQE